MNARLASRIEVRAEVMLGLPAKIGSETIGPGMIVRRDNGTLLIVRHSIRRRQISQSMNNQSQTLPLVDRLAKDPVARRSLNERNPSLMMILERAWKGLPRRLCRVLNRC